MVFYISAARTGTARQQPVQRVYPVHAAVVHMTIIFEKILKYDLEYDNYLSV